MNALSFKLGVICISTIFPLSLGEANSNISELEDGYVKHFGNDPCTSRNWEIAKLWSYEKNSPKLKKFCASAHALSGKGSIDVDVVVIRQRLLKFRNSSYHAMQVLVAAYGMVGNDKKVGILERDYWYTREPNHWYLTEGQRADCAYLLNLADLKTGHFTLEQNVCGIEVPV